MHVFVSWSGERSRQIADAIRTWLPMVVQSVKPWMSNEDIAAGARWLAEVSATLNSAKVGIICVTPENQHNPWLLFEAGALSKTLEQTCVCPLVFEMTPGQLDGPLTQFQANFLNRDGIGKVIATINKGLGERQIDFHQLDQIIDVWWPKLEEKLKALSPVPEPAAARSMGDQIEELLTLARENLRRENLRLEASRERDEKLDVMLGFLDKAGKAMGTLQNQAHRMQASITKGLEAAIATPGSANAILEAKPIEMHEAAHAMADVVTLPPFDANSMAEMTKIMRELSERDKHRTDSMLNPHPDQRSGE